MQEIDAVPCVPISLILAMHMYLETMQTNAEPEYRNNKNIKNKIKNEWRSIISHWMLVLLQAFGTFLAISLPRHLCLASSSQIHSPYYR